MGDSGPTSQTLADDPPNSSISDLVTSLGESILDLTNDPDSALARLDSLRARLRSRFIRHDDDLLAEAVFQAPWLTGFAETLRHEHLELLRTLDTMRERILRSEDDSEGVVGVQEVFDAFVELIDKHEGGRRNLVYESQLCQSHLHD